MHANETGRLEMGLTVHPFAHHREKTADDADQQNPPVLFALICG
jgi:hypothetical protein